MRRPYPKSDPRWWQWSKTVLTIWSDVVRKRAKPVILHSCHNACPSPFSGPTLIAAKCNSTDPAQQWTVPSSDAPTKGAAPSWSFGYLRDAGRGLCVGCSQFWDRGCADDAATMHNGSGHGVGMQACGGPCPRNGGCGSKNQQWNYSAAGFSKMLLRSDGACLDILSPNNQVTARHGGTWCKNATPTMQWELGDALPAEAHAGVSYRALQSVGAPGMCLSSGPTVAYDLDPWCAENNNMWRSSTDTLQVWSRVQVEIDSLVGLGNVSGPGRWGFADSLEIGIPGGGVLTWEESKAHLALYAVTSQPLFLSNDLRPGHVQPRLLGLFMNKDMLKVNQRYLNFAGDRMSTSAVGKEFWAKPLPEQEIAVVVYNRNGTTSRCDIQDAIAAPCDDNATESSGAQQIVFDFDTLPREWYGVGGGGGGDSGGNSGGNSGGITCNVRDIFSGPTAAEGKDLGKFTGSFDAGTIPPHGVRFLLLSACSL